jgi:hypothetical protein
VFKRNQDTNEALADFQNYAKQARDRLAKMGIDFNEVYGNSTLPEKCTHVPSG